MDKEIPKVKQFQLYELDYGIDKSLYVEKSFFSIKDPIKKRHVKVIVELNADDVEKLEDLLEEAFDNGLKEQKIGV